MHFVVCSIEEKHSFQKAPSGHPQNDLPLQSPVSSRSRTVSSSGPVPAEDTRKRARTSRWVSLFWSSGVRYSNVSSLFSLMKNSPFENCMTFPSVAEDGLVKKRRLRNLEENWNREINWEDTEIIVNWGKNHEIYWDTSSLCKTELLLIK